MNLRLAIFVSLSAFVAPVWGQENSATAGQAIRIMEKLGGQIAASSPRGIARMTDEERAVMIRFYRERMSSNPFATAHYRQDLLWLGDPQIVREAVETVLKSDNESPQFAEAASALLVAARPETVAMLAPGILVDEPFTLKPMRGDVGSPLPKSYGISNALLQIMARSPAFGDKVRKWADDNWKVDPRKSLPMVRQWWKENEPFLKAGNYGMVLPGVDLRAEDLASSRAIQARHEAYRNHLIAQGKSPADLANWEDWDKFIDPSHMAATPIPSHKASATPASPTPQSNPQTSISKNTPTGPASVQAPVWPWVVGSAALAVFVLLAWKRARS